ncbi:MAG: hypothetical protein O3C05_02295, partial [Proteobacteria bacterium]|nr:hypothetical protein [Pseudomonadota bacterium]
NKNMSNMKKPIKIALIGAGGRMGTAILQYTKEQQDTSPEYEISRAIVLDSSKLINQIAIGNIYFDSNVHSGISHSDIAIEFTNADSLMEIAKICYLNSKPLVAGSTGLSEDQYATLKEYGKNIPIFYSQNMSIGIHIIGTLAKIVSDMPYDFDISISEMHHKHKKDSPSGTAIMLAEQISCSSKNISAIRGGGIIGEHSIIFADSDEIITIKHSALNRKIYANGAIKAAIFLSKQSNFGIYSMQDLCAKR